MLERAAVFLTIVAGWPEGTAERFLIGRGPAGSVGSSRSTLLSKGLIL